MSRRQIPIVVGTLLLLAAVFAGLIRVKQHDDNEARALIPRGATEAAAMLAARTTATDFFTVDPDHVEKQIDTVLAAATGDFLRDYTARRDQVVANVTGKKQTVTAVVPPGGTAIASFSTTRAVVLIAVDATSKEGSKSPVATQHRMVLTMQRAGAAGWRAANLDELLPVAGVGEATPGPLPGGNVAVLDATATGVQHMLSSDYRHLDADLNATLKLLTGSFGSDYARTYDTSVRLIAQRKKSITTAYVRAVGLVVRDGDTARCLVFVDQVLNPAGAAEVTDARLFANLRRVNGVWLIDDLTRA